jgi:hypothetical protein
MSKRVRASTSARPSTGTSRRARLRTMREIVDAFADENDVTLLVADGFDDAILGVAQQFTRVFVVYDQAKCLALLRAQGMSPEDAAEYFEFNVTGAYVGESTPAFLVSLESYRAH